MSTRALLFAWLGPPEERPPFPIFDTERMPDATRKPFSLTTPCNWLQIYENTQDPIHVLHLHAPFERRAVRHGVRHRPGDRVPGHHRSA